MSNITLTIPNDDHIALRAFSKALEEMALAHGAPLQVKLTDADVGKLKDAMNDEQPQFIQFYGRGSRAVPEVDTTAQQVESLAHQEETHIITEQVKVGDPVPVDGGLSQGFVIKTEEIANQVDSTGTPWDERIHSASKALNSDGSWRLRRKPKDMDESEWAVTVQRVQDELRFPQEPVAVTPSGEELCVDEGCDRHGTPHICITPEPPVTPPGDDFHTDAGVVTEQTVAGIPPLPVPPPVVVPPAPHTIPVTVEVVNDWDFPKLMKFLTERHGKIDVPTVNQLLAVDGLAALTDLNAHPDKIGPFVARVKAHLGE